MRPKAPEQLEDFEIRPLFQLGRAAMSSEYAPDPLTHEGMIMLLNIIEDLVMERGVASAMTDDELRQRTTQMQAEQVLQSIRKAKPGK